MHSDEPLGKVGNLLLRIYTFKQTCALVKKPNQQLFCAIISDKKHRTWKSVKLLSADSQLFRNVCKHKSTHRYIN